MTFCSRIAILVFLYWNEKFFFKEPPVKQERITRFIQPEQANRKWYVVDATGQTLGRLATKVASVIRGKHKAEFTPNMDAGDFVIIVNAEKIQIATKREENKKYFHYSGYPGGLKIRSYRELIEKKPEYVIEHAVHSMLPKNRLGRQICKKLKVYRGAEHPHAAQSPETLSL